MEQSGVVTPPPKQTLAHILNRLQASQRPPDLDYAGHDKQQKSIEYERKTMGLFGNSRELLVNFGLKEDEAQRVSDTLQSGDWMFDRAFLTGKKDVSITRHEPLPVSAERRQSGKEPFGFEEVPTIELQCRLSDMVQSAVRQARLDPVVADKIMAGYADLTRYSDFGLSLQFPADDASVDASSDMLRFSNSSSHYGECYKNAQSNALIIGGWTSGINFARREEEAGNGLKNEADLSQQYLARKRTEGKQAFVVSCAGPGMGENTFTDKVTRDNPFGPHDHMLGVAAAYTLLGRTNATAAERELVLEGHSMGGAALAALLEHYTLPPNYNVSVTVLHPAIAGTNAWANIAEQAGKEDGPLTKIGQKVLAPTVAGAIDALDMTAESLHAGRYYTPLKEAVSGVLTRKLFLRGDEANMAPLVKRHVNNFGEKTSNSTLTALGSIDDLPLDRDLLTSAMEHTDNPAKFALVADRDDQMVETQNMLRQLPHDIPLFVLDDGDEGSHYAFKRNCRSLRLGLLQQSMEQLTKPQFSYLFQDLFMNAYQEKPQSATAIGAMLEREGDRLGPLFGVTKEELQSYLQRRSAAQEKLSRRAPTAERDSLFTSLAAAGYGTEEEIRSYYQSISGQPDLGLHYFYAEPARLAQAVLPESGNTGLAKIELMMETLEQLGTQVHFNLPSDPLLKRQ